MKASKITEELKMFEDLYSKPVVQRVNKKIPEGMSQEDFDRINKTQSVAFTKEYLNLDDLQELGWKYLKDNPDYTFILNNVLLIYSIVPQDYVVIFSGPSIIFRGDIRSKYELEKLMKELKIVD